MRNLALLVLFLCLLGIDARAQERVGVSANNLTFQLDSELMGRAMPYRVTFPTVSYLGEKDARFPVIYLLHGLTGHYDNWTEKTKLDLYVLGQKAILVTPEGGDGWYTDSSSKASDKYESYLIQELIPEIDKKFRTIP